MWVKVLQLHSYNLIGNLIYLPKLPLYQQTSTDWISNWDRERFGPGSPILKPYYLRKENQMNCSLVEATWFFHPFTYPFHFMLFYWYYFQQGIQFLLLICLASDSSCLIDIQPFAWFDGKEKPMWAISSPCAAHCSVAQGFAVQVQTKTEQLS